MTKLKSGVNIVMLGALFGAGVAAAASQGMHEYRALAISGAGDRVAAIESVDMGARLPRARTASSMCATRPAARSSSPTILARPAPTISHHGRRTFRAVVYRLRSQGAAKDVSDVCRFSINLIPRTIAVTTLKHLRTGSRSISRST